MDSDPGRALEAEDAFAVHVGWDQYLYVRTSTPSPNALARTRALGLFPEHLEASPYDHAIDEDDIEQRPGDGDFWARLQWSVAIGQAAILEEGFVRNATRWHRLTKDNLDHVRARLTPCALLTVWPDLSTDVEAVIAGLPDEGLVEFVWENKDGQITSTIDDDTEFSNVAAQVRGARAATALPMHTDDRHPLFTAVLPDSDGILRARWRTEPTTSDRHWAHLKTLRRGQACTGTVTEIASFGVTFVDIGGFTAMINIPELSWRHIEHPSDVVSVGQEITAQILDVDMVRERVSLSLKALHDNPMPELIQQRRCLSWSNPPWQSPSEPPRAIRTKSGDRNAPGGVRRPLRPARPDQASSRAGELVHDNQTPASGRLIQARSRHTHTSNR